jgi:hypothetical protein
MNKKLNNTIHEFNSNLTKEDNSKRIILYTLKPSDEVDCATLACNNI